MILVFLLKVEKHQKGNNKKPKEATGWARMKNIYTNYTILSFFSRNGVEEVLLMRTKALNSRLVQCIMYL